MPRTHRNALRDPQIPPDAKAQVQGNMSLCTFYGNFPMPTRAWKIGHRCFAAQTYRNALHDTHIPPFGKTKVLRNVSRGAFYQNCVGPTRAWKIVRPRFTAQMHWNALCDPQIPLNAKTQVWRNVSQHAFLRKPHRADLSRKNSASMFHGLDALECTTWPPDPTGCKYTSLA
jgi:hypothetical protein